MNTPEEIKKGLACCRNVWVDDHWKNCDGACPYQEEQSYCKNVLHHDALAYIKQLEAKDPQWISVKERLPETEGKYIVCTAKGSVYCAKFSTRHGPAFHTDMYTHITHWMLLPELPEEE